MGIERLSPRELEVLRLMSEGFNNSSIAQSLMIAPKTVERHSQNIYLKLQVCLPGVVRRVLAVLIYLRGDE